MAQCYNLLDVVLDHHLPEAVDAVVLRSLGADDEAERVLLWMTLSERGFNVGCVYVVFFFGGGD